MSDNSSPKESAAMMKQPWFREAYKAAMEFYKIDDQLDSRDRLELSKAYQSITRAEFLGGWVGFSGVFLTPFAYRFYKTNAIKGVKVPRNFMLGLLVMFGSSQLAGNYMFSRQLSNLDPDGTLGNRNSYDDEGSSPEHKTNAQRQYEMMRLLNNGSAARWAAYFHMTHQDPGRRLPNPEEKLKALKQGLNVQNSSFMNQRDPMGLYSGPAFDKKEGIPDYSRKTSTDDTNGETTNASDLTNSWETIRREGNAPGSSWDRVRQNNGANDNGTQSPTEYQHDEEDDPFDTVVQPSQSDFDQLLEKERNGEDTYQ